MKIFTYFSVSMKQTKISVNYRYKSWWLDVSIWAPRSLDLDIHQSQHIWHSAGSCPIIQKVVRLTN